MSQASAEDAVAPGQPPAVRGLPPACGIGPRLARRWADTYDRTTTPHSALRAPLSDVEAATLVFLSHRLNDGEWTSGTRTIRLSNRRRVVRPQPQPQPQPVSDGQLKLWIESKPDREECHSDDFLRTLQQAA